jgi:CubicO group peptidase (beta-lactamase class C family)
MLEPWNPEMKSWNNIRPKTARELGIMAGFPPPPEKQPNADNWDLAPFNRWSFQNMRSLFPTVDVYRGTGPSSAFSQSPADILDTKFTNSAGQARTLLRFLEETYTDGLLIYQGGKIRHESYYNDMQAETLHLSQSVAKSVVGTTAGILIDRGQLDLNTALAEYVAELATCGYGDATLDHVLNMQSGVRFAEDYGAPESDMTRVDIAAGWRPATPGQPYQSIRDVILTLPKIRPHGTVFEYRSIETDVVAWVLERVTGVPLAELVSGEIWRPMGAERDACFTIDRAGTALADGGFNATLRDYARFGRLFLERNGPVPESWITACMRGETRKFGVPYTDVTPNGAYRNSWWVRDNRRGDIAARGVFGQLIYVDRASDLMVVKLSSWPDYLIFKFTLDTFLAIDAIRAALQTSP